MGYRALICPLCGSTAVEDKEVEHCPLCGRNFVGIVHRCVMCGHQWKESDIGVFKFEKRI